MIKSIKACLSVCLPANTVLTVITGSFAFAIGLQTGQLIEEFFPRNKVRYIALNDAVDTNIENDITPFRNMHKSSRWFWMLALGPLKSSSLDKRQ